LGDAQEGADIEERIGAARAMQSGPMSVKQMKNAVIGVCIASLISTARLTAVSFS